MQQLREWRRCGVLRRRRPNIADIVGAVVGGGIVCGTVVDRLDFFSAVNHDVGVELR